MRNLAAARHKPPAADKPQAAEVEAEPVEPAPRAAELELAPQVEAEAEEPEQEAQE